MDMYSRAVQGRVIHEAGEAAEASGPGPRKFSTTLGPEMYAGY